MPLRVHLQQHQIALLIGSDCPSLSVQDLNEARHHLLRHWSENRSNSSTQQHTNNDEKLVFVPANDGGYVLVGASAICPEVFADLPWGSCEVMKLTREILVKNGLKWHELPSRDDVDRPEDLDRLPQHIHVDRHIAPKF